MEQDSCQTLERANVEFKKRNFKQAEELYTKFLASCWETRNCDASDIATAHNNRGQIKYFRVDFREAMEDYTSAIEANCQFEVSFYNRGLIRYRLGNEMSCNEVATTDEIVNSNGEKRFFPRRRDGLQEGPRTQP
uniref:Tetratricopeptide repeat protein 32 n=1 Tax=Salmo salar TaxID=8030 RepID=B9EQ62_SALSA|nr:Tetratricopeptide repeat protein 32 [Salmo salar]